MPLPIGTSAAVTTVLVFSAHLDDAVFSAGGAMAQAAQSGARVIVATLFTGNVAHPSGFALACQTDKGLSPSLDYMVLRREEDRAACAILGAEAWHGTLLEAPHRGYTNSGALFGPLHDVDECDALRAVMRRMIGEAGPDIIWAPRAVGHHVDHVLLHRGLLGIAPAAPILWYTDFPYARRADAPDAQTPALGRLCWLKPALPPMIRDIKADACAAYRSQLSFQFGGERKMRQVLATQGWELFATRWRG